MLLRRKRTFIHKSAIENITSHRGVNNGKSTMKGDGDAST
jgi:hypothetical protein